MKNSYRIIAMIALVIVLCFTAAANAEGELLCASNGSVVVFPDFIPPTRMNTYGKPFVYYTLSSNGQLTENYYDAQGCLSYVLGFADEFYSETAYRSVTHPFPAPSEFRFVLQRFDEDGRVQTIDLLDDVREVTVSYDRFGSKSIRVPEYFEIDEDGLAVGVPAITAYIYYDENGKISTCRNKLDDDWTSEEYRTTEEFQFFYDEKMPELLVSATEYTYPDLENGPDHWTAYAFSYEGDRVKEILCKDSAENETDKYLIFYYADDKLDRVTTGKMKEKDDKTVIEEYKYTYNDDGTLWLLERRKGGKLLEDYQMYYGENGRIAEFFYTNYEEEDYHSSIAAFYLYDEYGFLSEQMDIRQTNEEEYSGTIVYRYLRDSEGKVAEIQKVDDYTGETLESTIIEDRTNESTNDNTTLDVYGDEPDKIQFTDDSSKSNEREGELGSQLEVPYGRIKLEVEELISARYSDCMSYTFEVYHNPDPMSHTDKVQIYTAVYYPYGGYETDQTIVFEYNRASDLWSILSKTYWQNRKAFWYPEKFIGIWHGTYLWGDERPCDFELEINDIDFEKMMVDGRYTLGSWSWDWNDKLQRVFYERTISKAGDLPIVNNFGHYIVGVYEYDSPYSTADFIISPEQGVQFKFGDTRSTIQEATRIQIVD